MAHRRTTFTCSTVDKKHNFTVLNLGGCNFALLASVTSEVALIKLVGVGKQRLNYLDSIQIHSFRTRQLKLCMQNHNSRLSNWTY